MEERISTFKEDQESEIFSRYLKENLNLLFLHGSYRKPLVFFYKKKESKNRVKYFGYRPEFKGEKFKWFASFDM